MLLFWENIDDLSHEQTKLFAIQQLIVQFLFGILVLDVGFRHGGKVV
jgi:hypothetical protein